MRKRKRKPVFGFLLALFILIAAFISPKINPLESLGVALVIVVSDIEAWRPNTIPKIVADIVGFLGLNLVYWAGPFSWTAALAFSLKVFLGLVYLGGCTYFAYRVYIWFKGRRQLGSG